MPFDTAVLRFDKSVWYLQIRISKHRGNILDAVICENVRHAAPDVIKVWRNEAVDRFSDTVIIENIKKRIEAGADFFFRGDMVCFADVIVIIRVGVGVIRMILVVKQPVHRNVDIG